MRPTEDLNDTIEKLKLNASADLDARVHDEISRALAGHEKTQSVRSEPSVWRTIMKGKTVKIAAAAVILVAALILTSVFVETNESVVLAGVLEKVEQARAFSYKVKTTMTGDMRPAGGRVLQTTMLISSKYGIKGETTRPDPNTGEKIFTQMYILPDQKMMLSLMPADKKYMRVELDDDMLARMKNQTNDPREMVRQMLDCEYTELVRTVLNGVEVDGFETTDPRITAGIAEDVSVKLWVDVETWLPVLWEFEMKMNDQMSSHGVISDFQWNVPVAASDFQPVIPDDFTSMMEGGYKMPTMTEEAALEGLKLLVDMAGRYPEKIDLMSLMREFSALHSETRRKLREEIKQGREDQEAIKAAVAKTVENMKPIQSLGMFYSSLVQDGKEPVYYGQTVGPDDADAVLMRWKISDGQYRVVFGNLFTSDVSAEELAELEEFSIDDGNKISSVTEETTPQGTEESTAIDHYNRGEAHYFDAEYDQAFSELTKAIEIDPRLARAYVTRGTAYNDKNEFDLAIADFSKVIEIEPTNAHAYVSRGMAYGNKGDYDVAIADYSKAIEIDPTIADAYRGRTRAYYYKGEYDNAWKDVHEEQALGREVGSKLLEKLRQASGRDE